MRNKADQPLRWVLRMPWCYTTHTNNWHMPLRALITWQHENTVLLLFIWLGRRWTHHFQWSGMLSHDWKLFPTKGPPLYAHPLKFFWTKSTLSRHPIKSPTRWMRNKAEQQLRWVSRIPWCYTTRTVIRHMPESFGYMTTWKHCGICFHMVR